MRITNLDAGNTVNLELTCEDIRMIVDAFKVMIGEADKNKFDSCSPEFKNTVKCMRVDLNTAWDLVQFGRVTNCQKERIHDFIRQVQLSSTELSCIGKEKKID